MISRPWDEALAVASEADLKTCRSEGAEDNLLAGALGTLKWILPSFTSAADGVAETGGD